MHSDTRRTPFSRSLLAAALLSLLCGAALAAETPASKPATRLPLLNPFKADGAASSFPASQIVALELSGAEVPEVLKVISDISGWTIIPSEKLKGKISFFAKDTTCRELFDGLVKANDWVVIRDGNAVIVLTREEYNEQYGPVRQVMRVFHVGFAPSSDVAGLIKPLLSKEGQVVPDKLSGKIAVRDTQQRVEEVAKVIAGLQEGVLTEVFQLQYAAAKDVIDVIRPLVSAPTNVAQDPRTNQIVVTDHSLNIERIRLTIGRLDKEDICFTRTFPLEHADCLDVQRTLQEALGRPVTAEALTRVGAEGQTPVPPKAPEPAPAPPPGQPAPVPVAPPAPQPRARTPAAPETGKGLAAGPTIAADPRINVLIVTDTPSMLNRIEGLIKDLDAEQKLYAYGLKYADPEKLKLEDKLRGILYQQREHFAVDSISKRVTFSASAGKAKQVLALLSEWDRQPRQVFIEAKVISISRQDGYEVGTEFDTLLNELNKQIKPETRLMTSFPGKTVDSPGSLIRVGSIDKDHYQALLRLIETRTSTKLLSNPKVIALDGNPAQFQVATDEPYTEVTTDPQGTRIVQNVRFIPVGVILRVLPSINDEGLIGMDVSLEVSSLQEVRNGIPVVNKATAQSRVVIEKEHTLLIGGLISDNVTDVKTGVPILDRIPLLGWLFRSTKKQHDKSELVLLLTPHVAEADADDGPSADLGE